MRSNWTVTYEIVTEESAMEGDAAERGFLDNFGATVQAVIGDNTPGIDMSFRAAIDLFQSERDWTGIEADSCPISRAYAPRWFTDSGEIQFASGETRAISLHIPDQITASSRIRLARYLRCYGLTE